MKKPIREPHKVYLDASTTDFYQDPNGTIVFTEEYLRNRGYCCKNGCRHCPYGYVKPPSGAQAYPGAQASMGAQGRKWSI